MDNQINHNPANDPTFPIAPDMIEDTAGHRKLMIEDADAVQNSRVEDADDTEGHGRSRFF